MAKIVLGKPAVLSQLDEENGQLTYKGQVIGAATVDTPTQEPPSPGTGVDVAVVDDYTKLDATTPKGVIAVTANKYQKTEPVVLPESEETEEGYDNLTLLSNKRITLADDIPYNEEAFDEYLQYCLQNPYYKVDYVSDESAVYHEADRYRYMRRKESTARESDPKDYEFVENLQEGDSVAGLYRLREIKYVFEPWASVSDSWSDDDKYIAIGAAYVTDPVNNTADELNLDCDLILQVTGSTKKYALFVEVADSLFPYSKISPTRYRHISFFIYCFEDLLISTEYNVVQLRKGWNIGYEICSYDEEYNEYDARGFEAEQIDRISDWLHLVTKSDGCAFCSDGASNLLAGIFMDVVEEYPAGLYVKQDNWKCVASDSLAALRVLETKTHEHENTDILRRLEDRDGRLQYDGYLLGGKRLSNFYYSHTEDNVDVYYITVVEEYGYEHTQELRIVQGRNGQNAGLQLVYFRYASSLTNEKIMHETPMDGDDLIGLYIGTEDTAPTDPGRYTWAPFRTVNNLSFARIQQYVRQGIIRNYLNIGDVIFAHHNEYTLLTGEDPEMTKEE